MMPPISQTFPVDPYEIQARGTHSTAISSVLSLLGRFLGCPERGPWAGGARNDSDFLRTGLSAKTLGACLLKISYTFLWFCFS